MYPQAALLHGCYAAVEVRPSPATGVCTSDVLVGVNHAPVPPSLPPDAFHAFVAARKAGGPPTLSLVRVTNPAVRKIVQFRSGAATVAGCGGGCQPALLAGCFGPPDGAANNPEAFYSPRASRALPAASLL